METSGSDAPRSQERRRKFCIFMCGHTGPDLEERFGDFGVMFKALLRDKVGNEQWDVFYPIDDNWPSEGALKDYEGIVVSGSASDSFAQEPWILRLRSELATAVERRQKILGICFGCQLMAIVLGGRSGRAPVGLETGSRRVTFSMPDAVAALPWAQAVPKGCSGVVIHEMHQDCVLTLPQEASLLASSHDTRVEAWSYKDHVLCIQGHPEFSREYQEELIRWRSSTAPEALPHDRAEEAVQQLYSQPVTDQDCAAMRYLCTCFLKASRLEF